MKNEPNLELTINKNIHSEVGNDLNSFLEKNRHIYLEANPNYGKTYHFAQLGKEIKSKNSIYDRLIFCTPRLIIQEQIANELDVDFILNGDSNLKDLNNNVKIITSTFNSLHLISELITEKDLIIVDEAHELLRNFNSKFKESATPYYDKTLQTLYNNNSYLVLMSGTPTDTFHELFDLKHIKISKAKEIKTTVNITYSRLKTKEIAYRYCEQFSKNFSNNLLNIIYLKNKKDCGEIALYLNEKGFKAKALTSKDKSDNIYLNIAKKSTIPSDIQFIITTNVISVGTNILNTNIGGIAMINENDPMEIKQFSKRFRNNENSTIEVSNKFNKSVTFTENHIKNCQDLNKKIVFAQLDSQQKLLKTISIDDLERFINMSFEKKDIGSPLATINQTLTKFLANESNLNDELVKTYNTPKKLLTALKVFNDMIPKVSDSDMKLFTDLQESKSKEAKQIFREKIETIFDDFIENPSIYVIYSLTILGNSNLEKKEKFKQYLSDSIEIKNLNDYKTILKNTNSIFFETEILEPILEYIPYFKDLKTCLRFIKLTSPEHRKKHILSLHVINLIKTHTEINDSNMFVYKKSSPILQSAHQYNKQLLDVIFEVFFYLKNHRYIHISDIRKHLEKNKRVQAIIKNCDKNSFPFTMLTTDKINTNFLLGIIYGIFVIDSKKGRFKNKNNIQRKCFLFEQELNKHPKNKVLTVEIPYKKSISSKEYSIEKSFRILTSSDVINSKFI